MLHEAPGDLAARTISRHRAIASLCEELDAIDWYDQRCDAEADDELRAILAHNRDEEKEHACMLLEWLRRRDTTLDGLMRRYLFTAGPIVDEPLAGGAFIDVGEELDGGIGQVAGRQVDLGIGSLR